MIDLDRLAVPDNFEQLYSSKPELRNPLKGEDIRLHEEWRLPKSVAVVRVSGKFYLVDSSLYRDLAGRMSRCDLRVAASGDGSVYFWLVKNDDESAKLAADRATTEWVRVAWNTSTKSYDVLEAAEQHDDEVDWLYSSFEEILALIPEDRVLDSREHPVVERILGTANKQS